MTTEPQAQTSERLHPIDVILMWLDEGNHESTVLPKHAAAQIRDLQAKLAAREADAEDAARYRYLRRDLSDPNLERVHCSLEVHQQVNEGGDKPWRCWVTYGKALDVQVDLAMADIAATHAPRSEAGEG